MPYFLVAIFLLAANERRFVSEFSDEWDRLAFLGRAEMPTDFSVVDESVLPTVLSFVCSV